MIKKEDFVKLMAYLEKDEEYKTKLNDITREYNQENSYCFTNNDFAKAFDVLLRNAFDGKEWMYDCVWSYILEGREIVFLSGQGEEQEKTVCNTPEELYDFFVQEEIDEDTSAEA